MALRMRCSVSLPPEPPGDVGNLRTLGAVVRFRFVRDVFPHRQEMSPWHSVLDHHVSTASGQVSIATMDLAKGLEFRAVAVMACDDDVLPLAERIDAIIEESDLDDVYQTERHLLYVACTRARDRLLVTGVSPGSEFLSDFGNRS